MQKTLLRLILLGIVAVWILAPSCRGPEPYATLTFTGTSIPAAGGAGTLTETSSGGTEISVTLHDIPEGKHAWHIHEGSCENQGPVHLGLPDLEADVDGNAESSVIVDELIGTTGFYVNVHEFSSDNGTGGGITCANVEAVPVDEE